GGETSCHGSPVPRTSVVRSVSCRATTSASACRSASGAISPGRRQPQVAGDRGANGPPASPLLNPPRDPWGDGRGDRSGGSPGGGGAGLLMLQWPPSCVETRWTARGDEGQAADPSCAARLRGRRSVQCSVTYCRQAARSVGPCVTVQPAGTSANVGQSECWPSSLTSTR